MPSDLPADHIEIAAHQRDALYELVLDRLSGVGDVSLELDNKDYAAAERIATRFGETCPRYLSQREQISSPAIAASG